MIPNFRPNFARRPLREVGMPVALAIFRLTDVIPSARFHENDSPGPNRMARPDSFAVHRNLHPRSAVLVMASRPVTPVPVTPAEERLTHVACRHRRIGVRVEHVDQ